MTREEAKEQLLGYCKIIYTYSYSEDRKAYDIPQYVLSDSKTLKLIDKLCNEHETQLKAKDEDLKLAMDLSEHMLDELKTERGIKEYLAKELKAKDEEIELLKFIVEESIKKPMGVEPHSWSNYKMLKDNV